MNHSKWIVVASLAVYSAGAEMDTELPYAEGPYEPNWESLAEQYECPEWFRDAKFGFWASWSPQCVPGTGDWCAMFLYKPEPKNAWWEERGTQCYDYHVEHFGHPSEIGYKDYCKDFTADKWDPDYLLDLYQKAGAKYFVSMANHHGNFDNWDSTHQPWNSVNMGPKRDIVGTWEKAARERGLRYGISVHAARSWGWMSPAFGADREGPKKGIPYDGHMTKEDGKGKWWEGYDPRDLYGPPRDKNTPPSQEYLDNFYLRTLELVDRYDPDLLYFDDAKAPLGNVGLKIAAHYYNRSVERRDGKTDVVLNTKINDELTGRALVDDVERGSKNEIDPNPWQIDTCIGYWHYRANVTYKTPGKVIHMLLDAVSKNGNLLLNIPMKADGSIEPGEVEFLEGMADWIAIHGEGIYGTRPWEVYGEGVFIDAAGHNLEGKMSAYTQEDFRFTKKGQTLYAFCLVTPTEDLLIKSLAIGARSKPHTVKSVELLGSDEKLEWKQSDEGLHIRKPKKLSTPHSICFRISFVDGGTPSSASADSGDAVPPEQ